MKLTIVAVLTAATMMLVTAAVAETPTKPQASKTRAVETTRRAKPIRLFHPKTAARYKVEIIKRVVRRAEHVQAFFETHPRQARSRPGRAALWRHGRILRAALREVRKVRRELWLTLPHTNDWQNAVEVAQRPYPGTATWMLGISKREGQWSVWKWYSGVCGQSPCLWRGYHVGNDVVGGWMQFRWSTFAPYWRGAVKDLRRRGFTLPEMRMPTPGGPTEYAPWLSPLGQALTAGYMRYYGKDGCHWCL